MTIIQKRVTEIKTAVDSMNDSMIYYISTAGWEYTTTDGAHPDKAGAEKLGKRLAEEMGKILKAEEMRPTETEIANHTTKSLWHEGEVPFHLEEVVCSDICGTGVNVVATKNIAG